MNVCVCVCVVTCAVNLTLALARQWLADCDSQRDFTALVVSCISVILRVGLFGSVLGLQPTFNHTRLVYLCQA